MQREGRRLGLEKSVAELKVQVLRVLSEQDEERFGELRFRTKWRQTYQAGEGLRTS